MMILYITKIVTIVFLTILNSVIKDFLEIVYKKLLNWLLEHRKIGYCFVLVLDSFLT